MRIDTTYRRPDGTMQPIARPDLSEFGEIQWTARPKEPWHLRMFPNRYDGDFSEQWMRFLLMEKYGIGWGDWTQEVKP